MLTRARFVIVLLLAIGTAAALDAQITSNPIPAPIVKRGILVEVKDLLRLPDTRGIRPAAQDVSPAGWARINFVRDLPDGRRFANDSRGFLYRIDDRNQPHVYANVADIFPLAVYNRLESGFIGFVFHPEFARNGLFYTVHAERGPGNPRTPDFIPPGFTSKDVTYHNIITEWHATNPAADVFAGTRRELLREAHVVQNLTHPMGAVEFNRAEAGDADYGCLHQRERLLHNEDRTRTPPARRNGSTRSSPRSCVSTHAARRSLEARRGSGTIRFRPPTNSPPTAIRKRSARFMPTDSAMLTGSHGTRTEPCLPPTSG
jgi:hypothetical protein